MYSELSLNCIDDQGVAALCTGQLSLEVLDLSNSSITLQRYICIIVVTNGTKKQNAIIVH